MARNKNPLTGYAQELQAKGKYPLAPSQKWRQREKKQAVTPYLVIPNFSGDNGTRPVDRTHDPDSSAAIEIVNYDLTNGTKTVVKVPELGHTYFLQCHVRNKGLVGSYAGIAEFYTSTASSFDALAKGAGQRPAPLGYAGFSVSTNGEAVVLCQAPWKFSDPSSSILVRAYDPIVDMAHSYDYLADRHVARKDIILLDQINDPKWTGAAVNIIPVNEVSQTFTPALPTLIAIEIGLRTGNPGNGGDKITLSVHSIKNKTPIFTGSQTINEGFDGFLRFAINPPLAIVAGERLVMEVRDTGKNVFHWKYVPDNPYKRGKALFCGKPFLTNDFFFKTYGKA